MWKFILTWTVTLMQSSYSTETGRQSTYYYLQNKAEYYNSDKAKIHYTKIKNEKDRTGSVLQDNLMIMEGSRLELEYISKVKIDSVFISE